jgi:hypothetical protein
MSINCAPLTAGFNNLMKRNGVFRRGAVKFGEMCYDIFHDYLAALAWKWREKCK